MVTDPALYHQFVADPALSQVTSSMTGVVTFDPSGGGTVNSKGFWAIQFYCAADATYYYNNDTTKTMIIKALTPTTVYVMKNPKLTVTFGAGTNYVQAM